jgi:uncharacterized protein (TIGR02996 family)
MKGEKRLIHILIENRMHQEAEFLMSWQAQPDDPTFPLVFSDWLEEQGDPRSEMLRLVHHLTQSTEVTDRPLKEERLRELAGNGVLAPLPRVTNSIGVELVLLPAGTFLMGSPQTEPERTPDEHPRHPVVLTQPFYLSVHLVTQQQYQRVMGKNPSRFKTRTGGGKSHPVEHVSWDDAVAFCGRLSQRTAEKAAGRRYRLPTEAEWEYACRAGTTSIFFWGDDACSTQANFDGNLPYGGSPTGPDLQTTSAVGVYPPNAFGLFDMHGNVWEWCQDWYRELYYRKSTRTNPQGPRSGDMRVLRGGSWNYRGGYTRSADRGRLLPTARDAHMGFRVAMRVK